MIVVVISQEHPRRTPPDPSFVRRLLIELIPLLHPVSVSVASLPSFTTKLTSVRTMDLHPHLHLLVPSSSPGIALEVRFYIPRNILDLYTTSTDGSKSGTGKPRGWSTTSTSSPVYVGELDKATVDLMGRVERLIIASHPWGRFGGNMLYPYVHPITLYHLVPGLLSHPSSCRILTLVSMMMLRYADWN